MLPPTETTARFIFEFSSTPRTSSQAMPLPTEPTVEHRTRRYFYAVLVYLYGGTGAVERRVYFILVGHSLIARAESPKVAESAEQRVERAAARPSQLFALREYIPHLLFGVVYLPVRRRRKESYLNALSRRVVYLADGGCFDMAREELVFELRYAVKNRLADLFRVFSLDVRADGGHQLFQPSRGIGGGI